MRATSLQKMTRNLPLPGRLVRLFLHLVTAQIEYPDRPIVTTSCYGAGKFEITDCREYSQQSIFFLGYYEMRESNLVRRLLRPGDTFIDVGANLGWFSVLAAMQVGSGGRVVAFEPSSSMRIRLLRSISLNQVNNVRVEAAALSDEDGTAFLTGATTENSGLATIMNGNVFSDNDMPEEVATIRFDDYWRSHISGQIRLFKIDVEGAELKVLQGMTELLQSGLCDSLMVEISDARLRNAGMSAKQTMQLLRSFGYQLFLIGMFGLKLITDDENLQFANILAQRTTRDPRHKIETS